LSRPPISSALARHNRQNPDPTSPTLQAAAPWTAHRSRHRASSAYCLRSNPHSSSQPLIFSVRLRGFLPWGLPDICPHTAAARHPRRRRADIGQPLTGADTQWLRMIARYLPFADCRCRIDTHPITAVLQVCFGCKLSLLGRQRSGVNHRTLECHGAASRPRWGLRPGRGIRL
jgi:hypothetical protein